MAIKVCLEEVLKRRGMTSKELCRPGEYHGGQSFRSAKRQGKGRAIPHDQPNLLLPAMRCWRYSEV